jgi:F0F1-type ATP synthase delta subunit
MKAQQYAEALFLATRNASEEKLDAVAIRVVQLLDEKGHRTLLPAILRELEKINQKRGGLEETLIRVAKKTDATVFQSSIDTDIKSLNATQLPQKVEVDDTLIGGYEVIANGKRFDRTYKRSLLTMYTNLITNNE